MLNTLQIGDHILVNKFIYKFKEPKRGDIIVFKFPGNEKKDYIKRLIGLPKDKVEMRNNRVFINDKPLDESYTIYQGHYGTKSSFGPVIVPEKKLFMMGDNRYNSSDSREWGFLDKKKVKGKAFIIYWSWDLKRSWLDVWGTVRWKRIGKRFKNPLTETTHKESSLIPKNLFAAFKTTRQ
jgi:signal peptidase I